MRTFNQLALLLSKLASHRVSWEASGGTSWWGLRLLAPGLGSALARNVMFSLPEDVPAAPDVKGLLSGVIYLYANKMSIPRGKLKKYPAIFSLLCSRGAGHSVYCPVGLARISGLPVGMSLCSGQGHAFYSLFHGGSLGFMGEQVGRRQ